MLTARLQNFESKTAAIFKLFFEKNLHLKNQGKVWRHLFFRKLLEGVGAQIRVEMSSIISLHVEGVHEEAMLLAKVSPQRLGLLFQPKINNNQLVVDSS